jgi:hypothetical protein
MRLKPRRSRSKSSYCIFIAAGPRKTVGRADLIYIKLNGRQGYAQTDHPPVTAATDCNSDSYLTFFDLRQGGMMSDVDHAEKLIVMLGQRMSEQNGILRTIAGSLQGVEAHLRQMAISSNTDPIFVRTLSPVSPR